MKIKEFEKYNNEKNMPYEWIGQGYGYKGEWDPENIHDIIYIPEYGYKDNTVERKNAYSYKDFIDLCDGDIKKAEILFENIDWQFPETALEEME